MKWKESQNKVEVVESKITEKQIRPISHTHVDVHLSQSHGTQTRDGQTDVDQTVEQFTSFFTHILYRLSVLKGTRSKVELK